MISDKNLEQTFLVKMMHQIMIKCGIFLILGTFVNCCSVVAGGVL